MRLALCLLAVALPATAQASALECTFTTICSPLTDCQTHSGVPFRFEPTAAGLSLQSGDAVIQGTPLPHLTGPGFAMLFAAPPDSTIVLSVARDGSAVLTQQDLRETGVQSVSYFGACEPSA